MLSDGKTQTADVNHGAPLGGLAGDQVGGGGDLIGQRGDCGLELAAVDITFAAAIPQRRQSGDADGRADGAVTKRPAQRVGDDDADARARLLRKGLANALGVAVGASVCSRCWTWRLSTRRTRL